MTEDLAQPPESVLDRLHGELAGGRMQRVQPMLKTLQPAEIATLIESIPPTKRKLVWGLVDPEDQGEILLHVNEDVRTGLIEGMGEQALIAAAEELEIDDLADLLEDLPETVTQQVLRALDADERQRVESLMAYPPESAGGLMNTDVVTVRPDVSLDVVLRYLRQRGKLPQHTDSLFVVNRYGRYLGTVSLDKLLTLDDENTVAEIMDSELKALEVQLEASSVARRFQDLDLVSAPVVNGEGVLVGRITVDDVMDFVRDRAERELLSSAGLDEDEDLFSPIGASARRRAVWLGVNLITAFIAARVVGLFEATIEEVVALAVLMPVVASMGGVGGTQTLTLMVRGLALGQIAWSNARALLLKELAVALINGLLWAAVVAVVVQLWFHNYKLSLVIALAMVINQLCAAGSGVGLPLLLRRIGIDPALAGSVVLTTITDVVGFFAFLGLGALILL